MGIFFVISIDWKNVVIHNLKYEKFDINTVRIIEDHLFQQYPSAMPSLSLKYRVNQKLKTISKSKVL